MTVTSLRAAALCLLLASTPLAAQTTSPRGQKPTPVEAPATQPPVERPDETPPERRYTWPVPVVSIFQNHTIRPDDRVSTLTVVMGDAIVEGRAEGDVLVILGSARLTSRASLGGSLLVIGGGAVIEDGAEVRRELVVLGGVLRAPLTFSAGGNQVVMGTPPLGALLEDVSPWFTHGLILGRLIVPELEWVWVIVAVFFVIYLMLNTLFHTPVRETADALVARPLSAFFAGLLVLVLTVPVLVILAASVIGLAVVPFLLCGLVVAGLIGKTAVARAMGRGVVGARSPEGRVIGFIAFIIGMVVLTLAYMVPVLGIVTWALTSVLGLGAATATLRAHLRSERRASAPRVPPPAAPDAPRSAPPPASAPASPAAAPPPAPAMAFTPDTPSAEPSSAATGSAAQPVIEVPPIPPPPPPPPVYTQGLAQYPRATILDRLAAFVLDCILVAVANAVLDTRGDDGWFWFLLLVYHVAFWAWKGTTLGGIICNLKVTRTDGTDLQFQDALVRGLAGILSIAAVGIGFFWMLQDPERQTWHDKIAGTLVVKAPRHVVLP